MTSTHLIEMSLISPNGPSSKPLTLDLQVQVLQHYARLIREQGTRITNYKQSKEYLAFSAVNRYRINPYTNTMYAKFHSYVAGYYTCLEDSYKMAELENSHKEAQNIFWINSFTSSFINEFTKSFTLRY
jgi:hypothetical protein